MGDQYGGHEKLNFVIFWSKFVYRVFFGCSLQRSIYFSKTQNGEPEKKL